MLTDELTDELADDRQDPAGTLPVIGTYPQLRGLRLYSLAHATSYRCAHCGRSTESVMVAVTEQRTMVCPGCYAGHLADTGPIPGRRPADVPGADD